MKLQFEEATLDDTEDLLHIQDVCFYLDYVKYGACIFYHQSKEAMSHSINNDITYKILVNRKCVGEIRVEKLEHGIYQLICLCVIPEYENQGFGQKAVQFIEKICEDAVVWKLDTPSDKVKNHYFFHKCGYSITNESIDNSIKISSFEKMVETEKE